MSILADTNVISELSRARPDAAVVHWLAGVDQMAISVITLDEIYFGLTQRPNHRIELWFHAWMSGGCEVLPVTEPIARQAGMLRGQHARRGQQRTQSDMLIAATASHHGLKLATRDTRDFADCGLVVVDPFSRR